MYRRLACLLLACLCGLPLIAWTGDSLNYLTPKDTIFLYQANSGEKIFEHRIAAKQTLFSLARFYGLSLEELYAYNPGLRESGGVSVGLAVKIPIPNRAIVRYLDVEDNPAEFVPVCHVVRQGETLYRISKVYYKMPVELVMQRNHLPDIYIQPGKVLHIAWMHLGGIPDSLRHTLGGPLWQKSYQNKSKFNAAILNRTPSTQQGVAHWEPNSNRSNHELLALHRTAPIHSILEIKNPMSNRTLYVEVVGRIPAFYQEHVLVVLSPTSAQMLGALDPNFYVHIKY